MKKMNATLNGARKPTELEETAAIEQVVTGMGEKLWKTTRILSAVFIALSISVLIQQFPNKNNIISGIALLILPSLWFFITTHRLRSIDLYAKKLESGLFRVVECTISKSTTVKGFYKYLGSVSATAEDGTVYNTLMPYSSVKRIKRGEAREVLVAQIIGEKNLFSFLVD